MMRPMAHEKTLPAALFRWRTPGDRRRRASLTWRLPLAYCTAADDLVGAGARRRSRAPVPGVDHVMCFYGVGDHGGGPTRRQTAWIRGHRDAFPGARLAFSHPRAFFDAVKPRAGDAARGARASCRCTPSAATASCATSRSACAAPSTRCSPRRRRAAAFPAHAPARCDRRGSDAAWRLALFNQFHDVYGGTSLAEACDDARDQLGAARSAAESVLHDTLFRRAADLPAVHLPARGGVQPFGCGVRRVHPLGAVGRLAGVRRVDRRRGGPAGAPPGASGGRSSANAFSLLWPARIPPRGLAEFTLRRKFAGAPPAAAPGSSRRRPSRQQRLARGPGGAGARPAALHRCPLESVRVEVREDPSDTWSHGIGRFAGPVAGCFQPSPSRYRGRRARFARPAHRGGLRLEPLELSARLYAGDPRLELELRSTGASASASQSCCSHSEHHGRKGAPTASRRRVSTGPRRPGMPADRLDRARVGRDRAVGWPAPSCFALSGEGCEEGFTLLAPRRSRGTDPAVLERAGPTGTPTRGSTVPVRAGPRG